VALVTSDGPPRIAVPDVRGYDEVFARRLLVAAGFLVETVDSVLVKDAPAGTATGTVPAAGELQAAGRSVTLQMAR
jgi:beta-lactam-binding protein with PASTA domain